MKIFLSSTAYDLHDVRDVCVEMLREQGHEVLHHEDPAFPAIPAVHSHDRCVLAVERCDIFVCIIDRRYGGTYTGALRKGLPPVKVSIKKRKNRAEELLNPTDLSITWVEMIEARRLRKPILTFARQRTLDEKETRRKNPRTKRFVPAYVDKTRVFDFLDWITHCEDDNWIVPFASVIDLRDKMRTWVRALSEKVSLPTRSSIDSKPPRKLAVLVEGASDAAVVRSLVGWIAPEVRADIVPVGGSLAHVASLKDVFCRYAAIYDEVAVLVDVDDASDATGAFQRSKYDELLSDLGLRNVTFHFVQPEIEAWIAALRSDLFADVAHPDASPRIRERVRDTGMSVSALLEQADPVGAEARSPSLASFLAYLRDLRSRIGSTQVPNPETSLLADARDAVRAARQRGTAGELTVQLALEGDSALQAARRLESQGHGRVELTETGWTFIFTDRPS